MNKQVLFSIVIPTFNRAGILPNTIESILLQTYQYFEIIIIDDGSKDNTEEVIQKYLSDRVRYYKKANAERAAARNYGTLKANGDYINWFDSDDIMFPDNLAVALDTITRYNFPEIIVQGYNEYDQSGHLLSSSDYSKNVNLDLYKGNPFGNSPVMLRRDIALAHPYNEDRELSASEDYELWLRLAPKYQFYTSTPKTIGYIHHTQNSTSTMSEPDQLIRRYTKFIDYATADKSVNDFLGKHKSQFLMKNYLLLALDLVINNHKKPGLGYLFISFFSSPLLLREKGFYAFIKHFIKGSFRIA